MQKLIQKANELEASLNSLKSEYQALVKVTKVWCTCDQRHDKREMEANIKVMSSRLESLDLDIAHSQYYGVTA